MRHFGYNPYGAQDEAEERRREEAAYQDAIEEKQGDQAWEIYQNLPEGTRAIFSSEINEKFGELFDTGSEVDEKVNDLMRTLSLMLVQQREAA